jgi:hypothetical protein
MVDCHPAFAIPPESHFVVTLAARRMGLRRHPQAALDAALAHHRFAMWGVDKSAARESVLAKRPSSYAEVMRGLFEFYAETRGTRRWGDKTPGYVESIPFLAELFPDARFVHVIRDGRAVSVSVAEQAWGPPTPISAAWWWRGRVQRGRRDGARLPTGRYLELRFEDLVEHPRETLTDLCGFLDEEFHEGMLDYPRVATERLPLGTTEAGRLHERTLLPPELPSDRFASLPPRVRTAVEYVCRPLLESLRYPVNRTSPAMAAVASAYAGWVHALPARTATLLDSIVHQRRRLL